MLRPYKGGVGIEIAGIARVGSNRRTGTLRSIWRVVAVRRCKKSGRNRSNRVAVVSAHSIVLEGRMLSSLLLRRRRMAASMFLCLLTALAARVSARQEPTSTNPNDLELVISGLREDFPDRPSRLFHPRKFKVTLINHSSRAIVFGPNAPRVIPGYPTSDWRVLDPNGKLVPFRPLYICRVGALTRVPTLPMTDANLFVIHPGERRDLDDLD